MSTLAQIDGLARGLSRSPLLRVRVTAAAVRRRPVVKTFDADVQGEHRELHVHPDDWLRLLLEKDGRGRHVVRRCGGTGTVTLAGIPIVVGDRQL